MQRTDIFQRFGYTMKPQGLVAILAALFLVSQVLCCFHTHDLVEDFSDHDLAHHQGDDGADHQIDCDVCLIAGMPVDTGSATGVQALPILKELATGHGAGQRWRTLFISPNKARAPPRI